MGGAEARASGPKGRAWSSTDQPCLAAISFIMAKSSEGPLIGGAVPLGLRPGELITRLLL